MSEKKRAQSKGKEVYVIDLFVMFVLREIFLFGIGKNQED